MAGLVELFDCLLVVAKILLAAHEDDRETRAEMENFRDPLQQYNSLANPVPELFPRRSQVNRTFS